MDTTDKNSPKLLKSFGLKMAIILVMSSIIGSGVFKKVAPMSEGLLSPGLVILAWILAGVFVLMGVASLGELGAKFPDSGGPFSWLEKSYGSVTSYLYGWSCFTVIQTGAIASVAFIFAGAVNTFLPLPHLSPELESITFFGVIQPLNNIGAKMVSIILIFVLTGVNIRGAKNGGVVSMISTFIIAMAIIVISVIAFTSSVGSWETITTPSVEYPAGGFTFFGFLAVMVIAMRNAFWGYEGWVALGFIGEELKNPQKTLPRAMIIGIIIITFLYVAINAGYLYVMPIDELIREVNADENNIAAVVVMNKIFSAKGAYIVSAMILVSTFGCTNATVLLSSRVYYAMAKKNLFFKKAALLHPEHKTPKHSLIYQALWAAVLILSGSFDFLTDLVIFAGFSFYGLIVLSVIISRKKHPHIQSKYKVPLYPIIPIVFFSFCVLLVIMSFYDSPAQSIIGVLLVFSGLPFYYYQKRKGYIQENDSE